jgi:hypothetical protein
VTTDRDALPDWERLLAAERHVQHLVPGAVLVGGTAAALHGGRRSMTDPVLSRSRALWNRAALDLRSDEVLAQILDRGEMDAWRAIYRLAGRDPELRQRIRRVVATVPLPLPHFWLAALASLGEPVDVGAAVPDYADAGV